MLDINNNFKYLWWAVQGSNLWPLPCQGWTLAVCKAFPGFLAAKVPLWFRTRSHGPWATMGGERV